MLGSPFPVYENDLGDQVADNERKNHLLSHNFIPDSHNLLSMNHNFFSKKKAL